MRLLRRLPAAVALAGIVLASGVARAASECADEKAEKEVVLVPPTPADMCLLDSSQCAPSDPIPVPVQISFPTLVQFLVPQPPLVVDGRRGQRLGWDEDGSERPGVVRELLRPPR